MVVMSNSVTAILTMVIVLTTFFFILFVIGKPMIRQKIVLLAFYTVGVIFSVSLLNFYLNDLLLFFGKDPTLTGRTGLWQVMFSLVYERPILGYGIGLFSRPEIMYQFSAEFGWAAKTTHSSYIDLVLGIGLPGSLVVLAWIIRSMLVALMARTLTYSHGQHLAIAVSVITGVLTIASASSGVLLSNTFMWLLLLSMVLFCHSREVYIENTDVSSQLSQTDGIPTLKTRIDVSPDIS